MATPTALTTSVTQQLAEAASLMLVGMVVVFLFLTLLIFAVKGLTRFCQLLPQTDNNNIPDTESSNKALVGVPQEHIAAITAAVAMHRKK